MHACTHADLAAAKSQVRIERSLIRHSGSSGVRQHARQHLKSYQHDMSVFTSSEPPSKSALMVKLGREVLAMAGVAATGYVCVACCKVRPGSSEASAALQRT